MLTTIIKRHLAVKLLNLAIRIDPVLALAIRSAIADQLVAEAQQQTDQALAEHRERAARAASLQ